MSVMKYLKQTNLILWAVAALLLLGLAASTLQASTTFGPGGSVIPPRCAVHMDHS